MSTARGEQPAGRSTWSIARVAFASLIALMLVIMFLPSMNAGIRQMQSIRALESQNSQTAEEIRQLEQRQKDLNDPEYIKRLARERQLYTEDGETAYIVVDDDRQPVAQSQANKGSVPRPWYRELADYLSTVGMATEGR